MYEFLIQGFVELLKYRKNIFHICSVMKNCIFSPFLKYIFLFINLYCFCMEYVMMYGLHIRSWDINVLLVYNM